jgi:hypothetical protein
MLPTPINRITKWNITRTEKLFHKFSNRITIIAPSNWIAHTGLDSSILKDANFATISNVHIKQNDSRLMFLNRKERKSREKITLGVASMQKKSHIKGGQVLEKLEQEILSANIPAEILYLADFQTEIHNPQLFWSLIDYLLVTSRVDNSPNVIHEAKMLGIPVIATNVGGIPELLNYEYDHLIEAGNQVLEQVTKIIRSSFIEPQYVDSNAIIESYRIRSEKSFTSLLELYNLVYEK